MYRLVDCDTWADSWFEALEPRAKLFFLYLLTNPRSTSAGAFEITPRKMAFETGLEQADIERWLGEWTPRVRWWPEHSIVWIKNFYRRQGNHNEKTRINARRIVATLPIPVHIVIGKAYPELSSLKDSPSIPDAYPSHQTNTKTEHEQEQGNEPENEQGPEPAPIDAPDNVPEQPYAMWTAFCEAAEYDIGAATPQAKGKNLAVAKRLLEAGVTVREVVGCTRYLRSQSWRTSLLSLTAVESEIGQWRMAGRPPQERARASPRNGALGKNYVELAKEADERDAARSQSDSGTHPRSLLAAVEGGGERSRAATGDVDDRPAGLLDASYRVRS